MPSRKPKVEPIAFKAVGVIRGVLRPVESKLALVADRDNAELRIFGIDPQLAVMMLLYQDWHESSCRWLVYPQRCKMWHLKALLLDSTDIPFQDDEFVIQGTYHSQPGAIFVGRNDPDLRGNYQILKVANLPEGEYRKPVKVRVLRTGDQLLYLSDDDAK